MRGMKWLLSKAVIPMASIGRDRRPVVNMGDALSLTKRVLLVLPLDGDERQRVLPQIFQFNSDFPQWTLDLFFLGGSVPTSGNGFKGIGVVRADIKDISIVGLPRTDLLTRLRERDYNLAIDLSMDSHPFIPLLLRRSMIPLKMGINSSGRLRNRSYNLMILIDNKEMVIKILTDTLAPICKAGAG